MVYLNASLFREEELCDFVWQYEHRKRWIAFSDEEIQHINEAVKQGLHSTSLSAVKQSNKISLDFDKMVQRNEVSLYEKRIRCLISNSDFYMWLWRNEHDVWISYSPHLAFFLEVAYQKKAMKFRIPDYEFNLETFEQINPENNDSQPIKRESVVIIPTHATKAIIQKNELVFKKAFLNDIPSAKRSVDTNSGDGTGASRKKRHKQFPTTDDDVKDTILSLPDTSKIKDNIEAALEKEQSSLIHIKKVPVDAECPVKHDFHIYKEDKTIFSATLNQTSLQNNNNKFYIIQLLEHAKIKDFCVWRRWGRVGHKGQVNLNRYGTSLSEAKSEFEKKFYDKTKNEWCAASRFEHVRGKYDYLHMDLLPQEVKKKVDVESKLPNELLRLLKLICDTQRMEEVMKEMSYDSNRTPLGRLTAEQLKSGFLALQKIASIIQKNGSHSELLNACNDFYTKIPHNFGMKTPPIIKTQETIENKLKMLEALSNIAVAMDVMDKGKANTAENPFDTYYKTLNCSLDLLEPNCVEYSDIEKCLQETHGPTHSTYKMEIVNIFKCFRSQEASFKNNDNKLILWHGSRIINWMGILKHGLRIAPPEAPKTGYMFGKGIYFADVSSKSANYCFATKKKNEGILIMCEVSVGKQYPLLQADDELPDNLPASYNSVLGKGRLSPTDFQTSSLSSGAKVPVGPLVENPEHEGSLHYNEYIVYNVKQVKMKYLVQIKFNFN